MHLTLSSSWTWNSLSTFPTLLLVTADAFVIENARVCASCSVQLAQLIFEALSQPPLSISCPDQFLAEDPGASCFR
ncbi:hypothetical protein BC826DRAFT_639521 [Russula brevipes]|nr:hypothetical protein BC826DRAFT_639521 [Russula brevipes]